MKHMSLAENLLVFKINLIINCLGLGKSFRKFSVALHDIDFSKEVLEVKLYFYLKHIIDTKFGLLDKEWGQCLYLLRIFFQSYKRQNLQSLHGV